MSVEQLLVASAQWLNDHATAVVLLLASLALVFELLPHTAAKSRRRRDAWAYSWRVNIALLACALAISWTFASWLSPAFSKALAGRSGLLNALDIPAISYLLYVLAGVLLLDLLMYVIHRAMHSVPLLWRFHQVHHSDEHMNASTHFRQHPVQLVAVTLIQLPMLWLLGIPAVSWVFYAAIGTVVQLWQHSTVTSASRFELASRYVVVTPGMHRVHHDVRGQFHDANYSAVFPFWDLLFRTRRSPPSENQLGLSLPVIKRRRLGLSLVDCLSLPFRSTKALATLAAKSGFQTRPQGKI